jgi:hypothetical protein
MAYYEIEPWGEERADLRMGILAAATQAPYCKKGHTPRPADYMPKFGERPAQSEDQMKAVFKQAVAGFAKAAARKR